MTLYFFQNFLKSIQVFFFWIIPYFIVKQKNELFMRKWMIFQEGQCIMTENKTFDLYEWPWTFTYNNLQYTKNRHWLTFKTRLHVSNLNIITDYYIYLKALHGNWVRIGLDPAGHQQLSCWPGDLFSGRNQSLLRGMTLNHGICWFTQTVGGCCNHFCLV